MQPGVDAQAQAAGLSPSEGMPVMRKTAGPTCKACRWCACILKGRLDGLLQPACALPLMHELLLGHAGCQISLMQLLHSHPEALYQHQGRENEISSY